MPARRSSDTAGSTPPPASLRKATWVVVGLAFAALVPFVSPALQNGDAAVYHQQMVRANFAIRTTHLGYILAGAAVSRLLPVSTDLALNLFALALGLIGVRAAVGVARHLGAGWFAVLVTGLVVVLLPAYWQGSLLAEVDVPLTVAVAVAAWLWIAERPIGSGLAIGAALTISPLAALSLPLIVCSPHTGEGWRRTLLTHARRVALAGLAAALLYGPLLWLHFHNYFYGGRGILHAPRRAFDVADQLERSFVFLWNEAGVVLPLVVAGMIVAWRRRWSPVRLELGLAVTLLLAATVGERFTDVPVQLPQLVVGAAFASVWLEREVASAAGRRAVAGAVLVLMAIQVVHSQLPFLRKQQRWYRTYQAIAKETPHDPVLVGLPDSWNYGNMFEWVAYRRTKLGRGLDLRGYGIMRARLLRDAARYNFWFVGDAAPSDLFVLRRNHTIERRTLFGRRFTLARRR